MKIILLLVPVLLLAACVTGPNTACPPKSDTQIIADTISDILVPKIRLGC